MPAVPRPLSCGSTPRFLIKRISENAALRHCPPVQPWSPPDEPDKPRLPYIAGFSSKIHQHHIDATTKFKPALNQEYLEAVPQSQLVTLPPPATAIEVSQFQTRMIAGTPVHILQHNEKINADATKRPPQAVETAQLFVTNPIAIGSARGSQVVSCTIVPCRADGS